MKLTSQQAMSLLSLQVALHDVIANLYAEPEHESLLFSIAELEGRVAELTRTRTPIQAHPLTRLNPNENTFKLPRTRTKASKKVRAIKEPKPKKEPKALVPFGTYGEWDYPNSQWTRVPTEADVLSIMEQKRNRDPRSDLWQNEDKMRTWMRTKGWLPQEDEPERRFKVRPDTV